MPLVDLLNAIGARLRIGLVEPPQPDRFVPIRAGVGPSVETVELTELLEGDLNLDSTLQPFTFIGKNVQFNDFLPETPTTDVKSFTGFVSGGGEIVGGTPLVQQISATAFSSVPGVSGRLAQLSGLVGEVTGKVPIPSTTQLPVSMAVEWSVARQATGGTTLTPGTDFLAPEGLRGPTASFLFPPRFLEESPAPPAAASWWLRAVVTLAAGNVTAPQVTLPPLEVRMPALSLTSLVRERFRVEVPTTTLPAGRPGTATAVETAAENALTRIRSAFPGVRIDLTYTFFRGTGAATTTDVAGVAPSAALTTGSPLRFFLVPVIEPLTTTPLTDPWELRVSASVSNLPGQATALTVSLPPVPLVQQRLPVPLLMLAFNGRTYGPGQTPGDRQETYVFVSPGNPVVGGTVVDRRAGTAAQAAARDAVIAQLTAFRDVITTVNGLFPTVAAIPALNVLVFERVIGGLGGTAADLLVVDGTRVCFKLGDRDPGWDNKISSLAMIGPPASRALNVFQDENESGRMVPFSVPAGAVIATYTTIHESWATDSVAAGPFVGLGSAPSFGNEASSTRWAP